MILPCKSIETYIAEYDYIFQNKDINIYHQILNILKFS